MLSTVLKIAYMAPEVLLNRGHGRAVDWWGFGTLLYEMMAKRPPFYDENNHVMYNNILHGVLIFPKYFSFELRNLLTKLLQRDPAHRLGGGKSDACKIQIQPFYKPFEGKWKQLYNKQIKAPKFILRQNSQMYQNDSQNKDDDSKQSTPQNTSQDTSASTKEIESSHDHCNSQKKTQIKRPRMQKVDITSSSYHEAAKLFQNFTYTESPTFMPGASGGSHNTPILT